MMGRVMRVKIIASALSDLPQQFRMYNWINPEMHSEKKKKTSSFPSPFPPSSPKLESEPSYSLLSPAPTPPQSSFTDLLPSFWRPREMGVRQRSGSMRSLNVQLAGMKNWLQSAPVRATVASLEGRECEGKKRPNTKKEKGEKHKRRKET